VIKPPSPSHCISLPSTQDLPSKKAMALDNGKDVIWWTCEHEQIFFGILCWCQHNILGILFDTYLKYINSLGLSVCDRAWEGGFVFLRAQRCRQDGGNGFWMKVGQHGRAGHGRGAGWGDQVLTGGSGSFWASWQISSPPTLQTSPVHLTMQS